MCDQESSNTCSTGSNLRFGEACHDQWATGCGCSDCAAHCWALWNIPWSICSPVVLKLFTQSLGHSFSTGSVWDKHIWEGLSDSCLIVTLPRWREGSHLLRGGASENRRRTDVVIQWDLMPPVEFSLLQENFCDIHMSLCRESEYQRQNTYYWKL